MPIRVVGPRDPKDIQKQAINTTSRSTTWSRQLSPFFVGPIPIYGGREAKNLENAWQFSKVYPEYFDADADEIKESYFSWAEKGWATDRGIRYPMPKGTLPLFSLWDGERLTYVEARKKIYAPLYAEAVAKTDAFKKLKAMYETFGDVVLWDFDCYNHIEMNRSWQEVVNDPNRKMGHGFVLAMMLEGKLEEAINS